MKTRFRKLEFALIVAILAACTGSVTPNPLVNGTVESVKGFISALDTGDADKILSYYSNEANAYDASEPWAHSFSEIDWVYHFFFGSGGFNFKVTSFFVSEDGQHAALVGIWSEGNPSDKGTSQPSVALYQFNQGKIIWEYDYYGGKSDGQLPVQTIPDSANQPVSQTIIEQAKTTINQWETAFNNRNAQVFLSMYSDQSEYTDVIYPAWRVLSKTALEQEINTNFSDPQFQSKLDSFFVSVNGRFAAVQGFFKIKTSEAQTVTILEIENGKIIKQYGYRI